MILVHGISNYKRRGWLIESILISIKKLLGVAEEYTQFDLDIIMSINSALMSLNQLGIGPDTGFIITSTAEVWTDFIGDKKDIESVKSYIYLKSRLMFDPPSNSFLVDAIERQIKELEWRINIQAEKTTTLEGGAVI